MSDLKITQLQSLAGADLAATDALPIADVSASETKKITVNDLLAYGIDLIGNAEIPSAKISFASGSIVEASLASGVVTTGKIASDAVTGTKLADQSTCIVAADSAALQAITGDFVGQLGLTTDNTEIYLWQNSTWQSIKAAGSVNTIVADTTGIVDIVTTVSGDTVTIGTSLDNTGAAAQFLAGPTGSSGAVSYRTIAGADLPTATTSAKGGVIVNGGGLTVSGDTIIINNTVATVSDQLRKVSYNAQGIITGSSAVVGADLPLATSIAPGAMQPGTGLAVDVAGVVNHTNSVTGTTQNGITFDNQGHITGATGLVAGDIPDLPATKLTSGTLDMARVGTNAITGAKLANYAITKIGDTQPTADQIGQFFFNPLTRDLFLWDGNVFQPIGISVGEIVFAGTFDASAGGGTGLVDSVTAEGTAIGLVVGQALPAAAAANNRYYLVVSETGTITSGNAPNVSLAPPDIVLSNGNEWTEIDVSQTFTSVSANQVGVTPAGNIAATNAQAALEELDTEKLAKAGGTVTGQILLASGGTLAFEGSTDNAYETVLDVIDPTDDRTIYLPNASGIVLLSTLPSGQVWVGSASNVASGVALSGDVTITPAGVATVISGSTSTAGKLLLTDSISSTSSGTAATPAAVKLAYDLAAAALPASGGTMTGAIAFASGQTISGYAQLATAQNFTAAQRGSVVTIAGSGTVTINMALGNNFATTLSGNTTFTLPSGLTAGQSGAIVLQQDGTGSRLVSYSGWKFPGGTVPTATTTASGIDLIVYYVESASRISARMVNDVK